MEGGYRKATRIFLDGVTYSRDEDKEEENETARYDRYLMRNEGGVEKLLFLQSRSSDPLTATMVVVSAGGWVRFWSIDHEGGLLGQFNAAHIPGEHVGGIATDTANTFLITGDSAGYIKIWDITNYCVHPLKNVHNTEMGAYARAEVHSHFTFLQLDEAQRRMAATQSKFRPPHSCTNPRETWQAPFLMNSFQGHVAGIHDIAILHNNIKFITGSADHKARIWTIYGEYRGTFGCDLPWPPDPADHQLANAAKQTANADTDSKPLFKRR